MNLPLPIRVVGCGSALGDDALGWEAVRQLHGQLPRGIELHVAAGGHQILDVLDGRGTLILVDTVSSGGPPGVIHRFEWPDQGVQTLRPGSTHDLRPASALRLAAVLGILPPRVIVFGIEAESLGATPGLSAHVASAVPDLLRRIVELVGCSGSSLPTQEEPKTAAPPEKQEMKQGKFPRGWDEERVRRVLAH